MKTCNQDFWKPSKDLSNLHTSRTKHKNKRFLNFGYIIKPEILVHKNLPGQIIEVSTLLNICYNNGGAQRQIYFILFYHVYR